LSKSVEDLPAISGGKITMVNLETGTVHSRQSCSIVGGLGLRAAANTNRSAAPIASSRGARAAA
jgi:hypothetical protein